MCRWYNDTILAQQLYKFIGIVYHPNAIIEAETNIDQFVDDICQLHIL